MRVEIRCTYASITTACSATSIRRRGANSVGKNDPVRVFGIDPHRQVPGRGGNDLVAAAIALGRPLRRPLVRSGTDRGGRLGIHQGLQHRAEHQITAVRNAQHLGQIEQGRLFRVIAWVLFYESLGRFSQSLTRWPVQGQ